MNRTTTDYRQLGGERGNCYQNFVSLYFEVREFSSYSRGDFRLSYQFTFFCVIFLSISLRSLCSEALYKTLGPLGWVCK